MENGKNGYPEMKKLIEFRLDEHDKKLDGFVTELEGIKKHLNKLTNQYAILQTKVALYAIMGGGAISVIIQLAFKFL